MSVLSLMFRFYVATGQTVPRQRTASVEWLWRHQQRRDSKVHLGFARFGAQPTSPGCSARGRRRCFWAAYVSHLSGGNCEVSGQPYATVPAEFHYNSAR